MTNNDTLTSRLIRRRAELGMSQNQLAIAAKIAPAQISRYESGINKPSVKTMGKIAEALSVPFDWLAYGDETIFSIDAKKEKGDVDYWVSFPSDIHDSIQSMADETGESFNDVVIKCLKKYDEVFGKPDNSDKK